MPATINSVPNQRNARLMEESASPAAAQRKSSQDTCGERRCRDERTAVRDPNGGFEARETHQKAANCHDGQEPRGLEGAPAPAAEQRPAS